MNKIIATALILVFSSISAFSGYDPKIVKCPAESTEKVWQKNYDGCIFSFTRPGHTDKNKKAVGEKACNCIARELSAMSCEEIKRLDSSNPNNRDKVLAETGILQKCIREVSAAK